MFRIALVCLLLIYSFSGYAQEGIDLKKLPGTLKSSKSGDTILIRNGVYDDIRINLSGIFDSNVSIMPESVGGVTIRGNSTILIDKSENITLEGFLFTLTTRKNTLIIRESNGINIFNNYFYQCGSDPYSITIRIEGGSYNNILSFNTIEDARAMGILIIANENDPKNKLNTNNKIIRNLFYNTPSVKTVHPNSTGNGFESIVLGQGHKGTEKWYLNTEVSNNLFEQIIGDKSEIISNKTSGNRIISNTFLNNNSGITIRLGNDIEVSQNYLNNTTRGIRVFGHGHTILDNYIKGSRIGIELPSADYKYLDEMDRVGYFQSENILIRNNKIVNSEQASILIGSGNRKFLPSKIEISNNEIIGRKEFINIFRDTYNQLIKVENNLVLRTGTLLSADRNKANNSLRIPPEIVTGTIPFSSRDVKVGADWKRPKMVNWQF